MVLVCPQLKLERIPGCVIALVEGVGCSEGKDSDFQVVVRCISSFWSR